MKKVQHATEQTNRAITCSKTAATIVRETKDWLIAGDRRARKTPNEYWKFSRLHGVQLASNCSIGPPTTLGPPIYFVERHAASSSGKRRGYFQLNILTSLLRQISGCSHLTYSAVQLMRCTEVHLPALAVSARPVDAFG